MYLSMPCSNVKKNTHQKKKKQAFLFRGLSAQMLMDLAAGVDGRLLTPFSLWLGSIDLYRLLKVMQTLNFDLGSQDLFYF